MKSPRFQTLALAAVVLAALAFAGCRTAPVYNVNNAPVEMGLSTEQIEEAIIKAGASLGWKIEKVAPGHMVGILDIRSHHAEVDIPYTKKSYDIIYKSSYNLKYKNGKIHSNYNDWVRNLDRAIQRELASRMK